mgnify:FL=1
MGADEERIQKAIEDEAAAEADNGEQLPTTEDAPIAAVEVPEPVVPLLKPSESKLS